MKMSSKWNNIRILTEWLEQGRELELEGVRYGISDEGDILRMFTETEGVPLPTLNHIWSLLEKITFEEFFIMSSETTLTKMNQEEANSRNKS